MEPTPIIQINGQRLSDAAATALRAGVDALLEEAEANDSTTDGAKRLWKVDVNLCDLREAQQHMRPQEERAGSTDALREFFVYLTLAFAWAPVGGFFVLIGAALINKANTLWQANDVIWALVAGLVGVLLAVNGVVAILDGFKYPSRSTESRDPRRCTGK